MKQILQSFPSITKRITPFLLTCILLSGCWDVKEVNDLAIVIATGIDQIEKKNVEVTFLLYVPNPAGSVSGEGTSGSSQNTYAISTKGETFSDAVAKLQVMIPRRVFWGHSNIFIFGSALAKNGIAEHTDFILRNVESTEQSQVYISKGTAKTTLDKFVKLNIVELFSKLPKDRYLKSITLKETEGLLVDRTQTGIIPVSDTNEIDTANGKINSFAVNGSAVIHHGKLVDIISGKKDIGTNWVVYEKTEVPITFQPGGTEGKVTAFTIRKSSRMRPEIKNGKWKIGINVKCDLKIIQNTTNLDLNRQSVLKKLEQELNQHIQRDIEVFISYVQKELGGDVLHFYDKFHQKYPVELDQEKKHWDSFYKDIDVKVKVDARIQNTGVTNLQIKR